MRDELSAEFGYYPLECDISGDAFSVQTLPDLEQIIADVSGAPTVSKGWIYAGVQQYYDFTTGRVHDMPYNARVFGLPKTHVITLYRGESREKLDFLVWCMSFFIGMRLTTAEAGFLDATPTKPGVLVDFHLSGNAIVEAIDMCAAYYESHREDPGACQRIEAGIHALFLSQCPKSLEFESFQYLYMALDACFKLLFDQSSPGRRVAHAKRIQWMCELIDMPVPQWAKYSKHDSAPVAAVRNSVFHEALFFDAPLGGAVYGGSQPTKDQENVILQMQALVCRLLVAILGRPEAGYVRSPVHTRQIFHLDI